MRGTFHNYQEQSGLRKTNPLGCLVVGNSCFDDIYLHIAGTSDWNGYTYVVGYNTAISTNDVSSRLGSWGSWRGSINATLKRLSYPAFTSRAMRTLSDFSHLPYSAMFSCPLFTCGHERATSVHYCFAPIPGFQYSSSPTQSTPDP